MSIGENIRRIRLERNITQANLAQRVGVTQSMLAQIERGTKTVSLPLSKNIADVLGCSIEALIDETA